MDKKYKTYNWNIEMNLQEEAIRYKAIWECLSDDAAKELSAQMSPSVDLGDDFNVSSGDEKDVTDVNNIMNNGSKEEIYPVRPVPGNDG